MVVKAARYYENALYHSTLVRNLLSDIVNFTTKKKLIDVGCGSGRVLLNDVVPFLSKDFSEVVGVDKYQSMVEHCRKLNSDTRVHFEQLDITTKNLPKKFIGRFDLVTSFLALHYVVDYEQAIKNMQEMLKPMGELFYVQAYNTNPLYDTYRELGKIEQWKKYLKEFQHYAAHFSESNRESKLEDIIRRNGLKILNYEFAGRYFKIVPRRFVEFIQALDTYGESIPANQRVAFRKDFFETFCKVVQFEINEKFLDEEKDICFQILNVHAQKPL